nr:uncharacterized protein LOC122269477 [Parasteatoda tepidariorum]
MYVRIEGTRLNFIKHNQSNLLADMYLNVADYIHQRAAENNLRVGRQVILPSSFIGSPRNMHQNYLDAMSIVQRFGKPSLFLTMTCNPRWPEISENLAPRESSHYRPDIVVRVFHCKLNELLACIVKKQVFGKIAALIYTIEFQKRGLPHAHMLLTLDDHDNIRSVSDIDKFVSAEIPDKNTHPKLYEKVGNYMTHGPCGVLNPHSRRDDSRTVKVRGHTVDNRFIVPYNPYLLAKFVCHINIEVCSTVQSIKYIYKYVYKGYDCATLQFSKKSEGVAVYDEIDSFLNGRYVGSTEAAWRIFEYEMHYQSHSIIRLECHLPFQQTVYFREGNEEHVASSPKVTKLEAFYTLSQQDPAANNLLYVEIPQHYTWQDQQKKWKTRLRGADKTITHVYGKDANCIERKIRKAK